MKIINLNESQYKRLFEDGGDSIFLDGDDSTKKFSSETSTQTIITGLDGDEKMSKPVDTDMYADQQSPQQWGSVGGRKSSNTI